VNTGKAGKPLSNKAYAAKGAEDCPFCGSTYIGRGDLADPTAGEVHQELYCVTCNALWREVYKLSGWEVVEGPTEGKP